MAQKQINVRLDEAQIAKMEQMCAELNLTKTALLEALLDSSFGKFRESVSVGQQATVQTDLPAKNEKDAKFRLVNSVRLDRDLLWPFVEYVPYVEWEPGMSYWTQGGAEYRWSGNYDDNERQHMLSWLASPQAGLSFSLRGPYSGHTAYEYARDQAYRQASLLSLHWSTALSACQEADAKGENLWPAQGMVHHIEAFVHYIRHHPDVDIDRWSDVGRAIGLPEQGFASAFLAVENVLTMQLTRRNGVFVAAYPWFAM